MEKRQTAPGIEPKTAGFSYQCSAIEVIEKKFVIIDNDDDLNTEQEIGDLVVLCTAHNACKSINFSLTDHTSG